jgi:trans-aconitate methyltransferase
MELMRTGAAQVVGVDVDPARIAFARYRLLEHAPELADRVDFRVIRDVDDVEDGPFNLILSQDTFQVIEQPERTAKALVERLGPRGEIAIGISPLWNAPSGGLVDDVSWLPWAQLIFPEKVIVEESGRAFDDNRMSLEHFLAMMKRTGLEQRHLAFNVRPQRMGRAILVLDVLRALPVSALRELMTLSVYGIWRRPS